MKICIARRVAVVAAVLVCAVTALMMALRAEGAAAKPLTGTPPKPAPTIKDAAWAPAIKLHPRLLGPPSFLQDLAKTKPSEYAQIKAQAGSVQHGPSKKGQLAALPLLGIGIVASVDSVTKAEADPFIKDALDEVGRGVTNEHQKTWVGMETVARTYDFFYQHISPADRAKMLSWLNAELPAYTDDEVAFHNSTMSKINCYLEVAYATWGDNPKAPDFRKHALKLYEGEIVPVLNAYGAGGGYTECGWYTRGCLFNLVQGLELARRLEGYDGFAKAPAFFYDRLAYEMLQPYPGIEKSWGSEHFSCEGDGSNLYGMAEEYPRLTRNILASYWRGSPLAGYIAAKDRKGSNAATREFDFLWDENLNKPADLKPFPLAHAALGIGKVYARGDWTDDASWLRFECGDPFTQHCHMEAGSFEIFRRERLATQSGEYNDDWSSPHAVNWLIRTVANNCILVYMPGETFSCTRNEKGEKMANDGGQLDNVDYNGSFDLPSWQARRATNDHAQVLAYDNEPAFMYVAGDCTKAYNRSKVSLCLRQIVFIRPHTFVIFDHVNSVQAKYPKTWLMHCVNEPKIDGNDFVVTNGQGKLTGRTLLPANAKLTSVNGYTYSGQTFDAKEGGTQNPTAVKWRVEVEPTTPSKQDVFLHVLQTEDNPVPATLVQKKNLVGAAGGDWEVLFDANLGGTVTIAGKPMPFKCVLKPGEYE